jgi:serine protease Do
MTREARPKRMKSLILLMASFGVALIATSIQPAGAKDAPKPSTGAPRAAEANLPGIKYDGQHAATLSYGDLTVTLDSERGTDPDSRIPVFTGRYRDEVVFSFRIEEAEADAPRTEARVMRLDPKTSVPQVVMTAFTGGAHCCTVTKIATIATPDEWRVLDAGQLDGEGYQFIDVDNDGAKELISFDNSFLYAFDSYASSYAPTRIAKLTGSDINDVTDEPKYRAFLRRKLQDMEADARKDSNLWHSNGFLGGWVAAKSLVGEVDDAWKRMLAAYDRKSDWSLEECTTGEPLDRCPKDKVRQQSFPEALKKALESNNYPLPKAARR